MFEALKEKLSMVVVYENLKRLIVGKISILIAENSLDYSSDYKEEMWELDNLKDILEFGNAIWMSVNWSLGRFSPLPALFEEGEWLKQYSRTLADSLVEKETELKKSIRYFKEKESEINSLEGILSRKKQKYLILKFEKRKLNEQVDSLKNRLIDEKNRLEWKIADLVQNLSKVVDENKENVSNYNSVKEELQKAKAWINKEKNPANSLELEEKNKIIENLLVEKGQSFSQKSIIGVAGANLLIGVLIIKWCGKKKKKTGRRVRVVEGGSLENY